MTSTSCAAGTIVAKSCLHLARVLAQSFREHHPEIPFFVLLADEVDGHFDPAAEAFELLRLSELKLPRLERLRFRYGQQPLSYALTPVLLRQLLDRGFGRALFIKQESLVLAALPALFDALERHPIVLTPHLLEPLAGPDGVARELNVLLSGSYNLGVLGVSETPTAREFLDWWQDRLATHCLHDAAHGLHFEQRWIDLVPAYFEGTFVLRDPGYNVGHWCLPERDVQVRPEAGQVTVDGQPCRLFRFSGYDPDRPQAATRHSSRLSVPAMGAAGAVFRRYHELLLRAGNAEVTRWPYAYGAFDNGVTVPDVARELYRGLGDAVEVFGDPLQAGHDASFFRWLTQPAEPAAADAGGPSRPISRLLWAVYQQRPDVQRAFPEPLGANRRRFLDWARRSAPAEHGIDARFLAAPSAT